MVKRKRSQRNDVTALEEPEPKPPDVFQSLPHELHQEIFRECVHEMYPNSTWRRVRMTIRLSHVARSWRRIALSDTRLWTVVATPPGFKTTDNHTVKMVKAYIKRSGRRPLDLFIHFDGKRAVRLFEAVFSQISRWRQINFTATFDSYWFDKLKNCLEKARAPLLEHISLLGVANPLMQVIEEECIGDNLDGELHERIFQNGAPLLQSIVMNNDAVRYLLPPLHWRLRLLHIYEATPPGLASHTPPTLKWHELKQIFSLPNLEDLMITGCMFDFLAAASGLVNGEPNDLGPLNAPRLRFFCIDWAPYDDEIMYSDIILTKLVADNLERLTLTCAVVADERIILQLDIDALNILPSVTTLEIHDCFFGYKSYFYFMKLCPNLQILNVWIHFAGYQDHLKMIEAYVFNEREADDPGQQDPDWYLQIVPADSVCDSRWYAEQDAVTVESTSRGNAGFFSDDWGCPHRRIRLIQVQYDLFKELSRAERKFGKLPAWPSLSVFGYWPLSTRPDVGRTWCWLEYRKKKKAVRLSVLRVPTSWLADDDGIFQMELAEIQTYVDKVEAMEDDSEQW
ncbi:hypothetical protein GALMADRAFT_228185 [Galerina marginata CBS 339.88]|uniref:Uncharacterized protein n=1 Tax=Galerina marginata (strain CBS 339.88) TaxID=685588 RepID=A0A067T3X5_GALM3|nr:hypothetical protein GALMADRAFT_228185 [Galerina marginata CBS 339.88]